VGQFFSNHHEKLPLASTDQGIDGITPALRRQFQGAEFINNNQVRSVGRGPGQRRLAQRDSLRHEAKRPDRISLFAAYRQRSPNPGAQIAGVKSN
jgi:hypothetical protein